MKTFKLVSEIMIFFAVIAVFLEILYWRGDKLNNDFICDSLKGRVNFNPEEKIFLTVDGEEILYSEFIKECSKNGNRFDFRELKKDFEVASNLDIEMLINSKNPCKIALALLDKRLRLQDLKKLKEEFENEEGLLSFLYNLRYQAEGFYF